MGRALWQKRPRASVGACYHRRQRKVAPYRVGDAGNASSSSSATSLPTPVSCPRGTRKGKRRPLESEGTLRRAVLSHLACLPACSSMVAARLPFTQRRLHDGGGLSAINSATWSPSMVAQGLTWAVQLVTYPIMSSGWRPVCNKFCHLICQHGGPRSDMSCPACHLPNNVFRMAACLQ